MKRKTTVIGAIAAVLLALSLSVAAAYAAATRGPGRIELNIAEMDFGAVPNTQAITHDVPVRNAGRGTLEIIGVSTSCGCTTATVDDPHLAPGEGTRLRITFDPQAHNGAVGEFMRQVYVRSTDPKSPEVTITFQVTVVAP